MSPELFCIMDFAFSFDDLFVTKPRARDDNSFIMNICVDKYRLIETVGYINSTQYSNMRDTGCFIIIVNTYPTNNTSVSGPNAIFCIAKSETYSSGTVNTLVQSTNRFGDTFELEWNPGEYPLLMYNYKRYDERNDRRLFFVVKVLTSF